MYKVIKLFADLHDNEFTYHVGDIFPRKGVEVSETRIAELSGSNNKQGEPLIELVADEPEKETAPKKKESPQKNRGIKCLMI